MRRRQQQEPQQSTRTDIGGQGGGVNLKENVDGNSSNVMFDALHDNVSWIHFKYFVVVVYCFVVWTARINYSTRYWISIDCYIPNP